MKELAKRIEHDDPRAYAPPAHREERAVDQLQSFGELPTRELDEIIRQAKNELASIENDAQTIRDAYVRHTSRIRRDIERFRQSIQLSMDTMKQLREQCMQLDSEKEPTRERD
jgi:hypothetical protein